MYIQYHITVVIVLVVDFNVLFSVEREMVLWKHSISLFLFKR